MEGRKEKKPQLNTISTSCIYISIFIDLYSSGMPVSTYANTRLFKKVWLSVFTSNAYLCILQRARGSGEGDVVVRFR